MLGLRWGGAHVEPRPDVHGFRFGVLEHDLPPADLIRVADDERGVLLDVSRKLEYVPGGSFAKLQHELSISE